VKGPAIRSRLVALRRTRAAAVHGRDLLDRKREALLRELRVREAARTQAAAAVAAALGSARARLDDARLELGRDALERASLAQEAAIDVEVRQASLVGVTWPRLTMTGGRIDPKYGAASTADSLDAAVAGYAAVLALAAALAEADAARRAIAGAFRRTVRRLNALDERVLPALAAEIAGLQASFEEEERDEAFRRKRFLAAHRGPAEKWGQA